MNSRSINNELSSFKIDYFVTLYISGTALTKKVKWGIKISSYFVAIKRAVIPNKGNLSIGILISPRARSMILVAMKKV